MWNLSLAPSLLFTGVHGVVIFTQLLTQDLFPEQSPGDSCDKGHKTGEI